MTEQCTMFCRVKDCESLEQRLSILEPTSIEFDKQTRWTKCTCTTKGGVVAISRKVFVKQADDFCKLCARTMVYFDRREEANPEGVKKVHAHLEDTELLLGIVVEPDFDSIKNFQKLLLNLAIEYKAMIFNGAEMLDFRGNVIA
jgi:hypothetical protein